MKTRHIAVGAFVALLSAASIFANSQMNSIQNSGNAEARPLTSPVQVESGRIVNIETTAGPIKVLLYDATPKHRDNFLKLASEGYYDGVLFHRVIKDFMVQTGDPDSKGAAAGQELGSGDPGYTLEAEINYPRFFHKYGALAAARTGDQVNPERRSSGSQFYIVTGNKYSKGQLEQMEGRRLNQERQQFFRQLQKKHQEEIKSLYTAKDTAALENLRQKMITETEETVKPQPLPQAVIDAYTTVGGTPHLDGQYTVFGEVLEGMETVEKIQNAATNSSDRPLEDIRVLKITVEPENK